MKKVLAVTVSDKNFFAGTLSAVNSFLHYHPVGDVLVVSSGEYSRPLTKDQRRLLDEHPRVTVKDHTEFAKPGRVLGAWQLKAYAPADSYEGYDLVMGFDSDLVFCSNVEDIINSALETGKFHGGKDGGGVTYGPEYESYGISSADRVPYMSTSCYFCPLTETNKKILSSWAEKTNTAKYGPQEEKVYAGHGDQGVLNACIFAETKAANVALLPNDTWSQHWVYEDHVVEWDGEALKNFSTGSRMRTIHCGGSDKFWAPAHSEKRRATGGSQRWSYAQFLRFLFLGECSQWDFDPALAIPDRQSHLFKDLLYYHQLIKVMEPDFDELYFEKVNWKLLDRITKTLGLRRAMSLCGDSSMDKYIELAASLPDGSTIVEVGSFHGGSIVTLAAALAGRRHTVWSVESFTGNLDNTVDGLPLSHLEDFVDTVKTKVPFLNINTMQLPGQIAANNFDDESLDLVLIDGDHSTEAVCRDIDVWLPKVKKSGILCGDDIEWQTVEDAVIEKFGSNFSKGQSVWWVYK